LKQPSNGRNLVIISCTVIAIAIAITVGPRR
jgi:hypothetical protein